ncbi:MAG: hypothetical protein K6T88_07205, partial [Bacillus sp. (in: Bacteria)]|nr:hypothetical protein [Bacillus sp. (in: firmicutes)]
MKKTQSLLFKLLSLITLLLVLPTLFAGVYLYIHTSNDLTQMEKEKVTISHQATESLIKKFGDNLLGVNKTNSYWEDYRQAIKNKDGAWINDNVNSGISVIPNVNFIATTDLEGKVISQVGGVKEFSGSSISSDIMNALKGNNEYSGLMETSKGLAIIAVSKVTNEEGNAEPTGILIFGRIVDNKALLDIKDIMHDDIGILASNGTMLTTSDKIAKSDLSNYLSDKSNDLHIFKISQSNSIENAQMITTLKDFTNKPIGILFVNQKQQTSTSIKSNLGSVNTIIGVIYVVILILLSLLIYRHIIKPLNQLVFISEDVSKGNLKNEVSENITKRKDELGKLGYSMNILIMNFRNLIKEIKKNIDHSAVNAQELEGSMNKANDSVSKLVASIQQVAGNTSVAASNVEEISAAVEQMSASINLVAVNGDSLGSAAEETSSAIQEMMASIEQV